MYRPGRLAATANRSSDGRIDTKGQAKYIIGERSGEK